MKHSRSISKTKKNDSCIEKNGKYVFLYFFHKNPTTPLSISDFLFHIFKKLFFWTKSYWHIFLLENNDDFQNYSQNIFFLLLSSSMYYSLIIPSPLGDIMTIANDSHLLMLEFTDSKELAKKISIIVNSHSLPIMSHEHHPILFHVKKELDEYFAWTRKNFTLPLKVSGTDFQMKAWEALQNIPFGETRSYEDEAIMIGNPKAVRAIWGANHHNHIVIIIPCHRVIGKSGKLVGYGGGLTRKVWLLEHEKNTHQKMSTI